MKSDPVPARAAPYVALYPLLHQISKEYGYALSVHGSAHRDLDLIAVPWITEAADPLVLIKAIQEAVAAVMVHDEEPIDIYPDRNPQIKPHGRLAYALRLTNKGMYGGYLDISVLPRDGRLINALDALRRIAELPHMVDNVPEHCSIARKAIGHLP